MRAVTYFRQQTIWTCGPAALRMALAELGIRRTEHALTKLLRASHRHGVSAAGFAAGVDRFRLSYRVVRGADIASLRRATRTDVVITIYYLPEERTGHFTVVRDVGRTYITLDDPWYGPGHRIPLSRFERRWHDTPGPRMERRWYLAIRRPSG